MRVFGARMDASLNPRPTPASVSSNDVGRHKPHFIERIREFAARRKEASVFTGEHFSFLKEYLDSQRYQASENAPTAVESAVALPPIHLVINQLNSGGHGGAGPKPFSTSSIVAVNATARLDSVLTEYIPEKEGDSLLVLLSGWQPADWLRLLGAHCHVEPELMRRHLGFLENRTFFDQPCLPSSRLGIWRLRIVTIYVRRVGLSPEEVRSRRHTDASDIHKYLHNLKMLQPIPIGTSILRQHAVIDETHSAIIQDVSLCVHTRKKSGAWIGTAWFDSGHRFGSGSAPWLADLAKANGEDGDPFVPFVVHWPGIALSPCQLPSKTTIPTPVASDSSQASQQDVPHCPSFSHLPSQYGSSLQPHLFRVDALYAFSELIFLAANAENQFLNLIRGQIDVVLRSYKGIEASTIDNLQYLTTLLNDLIERSQEVVYILENDVHNNWPRAAKTEVDGGGADWETRETVRKKLLDDYNWILQRGKAAKERIESGTASITTNVTARDAQRSIDQARKVGNITVLAYIFLPLSLATAIFGMNFVEFKERKWGVTVYVCTLVAITTPSLVLCFREKLPCLSSKTSRAPLISDSRIEDLESARD